MNYNETGVADEAALVAGLGNFFGWIASAATTESKSNIFTARIATTTSPSTPVEVATVAHVALDGFRGSDVTIEGETGADTAPVTVSHSRHSSDAATG